MNWPSRRERRRRRLDLRQIVEGKDDALVAIADAVGERLDLLDRDAARGSERQAGRFAVRQPTRAIFVIGELDLALRAQKASILMLPA